MLIPRRKACPDVVVVSDASGTWGCGAYWGRTWLQLPWEQGTNVANRSIACSFSRPHGIFTHGLHTFQAQTMIRQMISHGVALFLSSPRFRRPPLVQLLYIQRPSTYVAAVSTRLVVPALEAAVQHYLTRGLAPATHRSYSSGINKYFQFCTQFSITNPLPVT